MASPMRITCLYMLFFLGATRSFPEGELKPIVANLDPVKPDMTKEVKQQPLHAELFNTENKKGKKTKETKQMQRKKAQKTKKTKEAKEQPLDAELFSDEPKDAELFNTQMHKKKAHKTKATKKNKKTKQPAMDAQLLEMHEKKVHKTQKTKQQPMHAELFNTDNKKAKKTKETKKTKQMQQKKAQKTKKTKEAKEQPLDAELFSDEPKDAELFNTQMHKKKAHKTKATKKNKKGEQTKLLEVHEKKVQKNKKTKKTKQQTFSSETEAAFNHYLSVEKGKLSLFSSSLNKMSPLMSREEIQFFRTELSKADAYLEFGVGGSTALASTFPNLKCYKGIDSSKKWIEKVSKEENIAKAIEKGVAELKHVDIGETGYLGYPADNTTFAQWPKFSDEGFGKCHTRAKHRMVLVDGRFRVACFLKVLLGMNQKWASKTHMLIHDYNRKDYHAIEEFADLIEIHGRLALFKKKSDVDHKSLKEATLKFEHKAH